MVNMMTLSMLTLLTLSSVGLVSTIQAQSRNTATQATTRAGENEYCMWETFNATCTGANEMISITSARYGRMRDCRCLTDKSVIGCAADVSDLVKLRCDKLTSCAFSLPDRELAGRNPCRRGLATYLEVDYLCGSPLASLTTERSVTTTVRLAGSELPHEGRLEVYYNGQWGTVCDDDFDDKDATVACKSLGSGFIGKTLRNRYGPGTGQIWLDNVNCSGSENNIGSCVHNDWGSHDCFHSEDVSIRCVAVTPSPTIRVRLAGSGLPHEGRLEVYYNGTWGTVCDDDFDDGDATVACKSLGSGFTGQSLRNRYGAGAGPIWLDGVNCNGSENYIGDCRHNGWGTNDCIHKEDVSIACNGVETTTANVMQSISVRLAGSGLPYEGRLEVYYNGQWGTVCDDYFDDNDATVACESIFGSEFNGRISHRRYGPGTGQIWLDDVQCNGSETTLSDCSHNGWGTHNCDHSEDVSISCWNSSVSRPTDCPIDIVFVVDGSGSISYGNYTFMKQFLSRLVGRLDIDSNGTRVGLVTYGTIVGTVFNFVDYTSVASLQAAILSLGKPEGGTDTTSALARVRTTMLTPAASDRRNALNIVVLLSDGHSDSDFSARREARRIKNTRTKIIALGVGNVDMYELKNIASDPHSRYAIQLYDYSSLTYVEELLRNASCSVPTRFTVRLVGSGLPYEGRLEVYYNGQWGTVCDDSFANVDATVACKSLFGSGFTGQSLSNRYGRGTGPIWLDNLRCSGSETHIFNCGHYGWGRHDCGHSEDVSIRCTHPSITTTTVLPPIYPKVRLVGVDDVHGRLEVFHNGTWGTVCGDYFNEAAAKVVCNMLGHGYIGTKTENVYRTNSGQIWLDHVQCKDNKRSIEECSHRGWGVHSCTHFDDVAISCSTVRVAGGWSSREGKLEVFHKGVWGAVCADAFYFKDTDASNVCSMLGFGKLGYVVNSDRFTASPWFWSGDIRCNGNESNIEECLRGSWRRTSRTACSRYGYSTVSISCKTVRLFRHRRLEVFYNRQWGTVCDDGFNQAAARVVCKSLGFRSGSDVTSHGYQAYNRNRNSTARIWLDDIRCVGTESHITYCSHSPWGVHNCAHSEDVYVTCW